MANLIEYVPLLTSWMLTRPSQIIPLLPQQAQSAAWFIYNRISSIPQISGVLPWAVALVAGYLLLTTLLSTARYAYRVFVFFSKIAAIVGVIATILGSSGQGGIADVWNTVSPWLGMGTGQNRNGGVVNNLAGAANLFTGNGDQWWRSFLPADTAPASSRTRSKRAYKPKARYDPRGPVQEDAPNPIADAINNAADSEYVQGWVKSALGKVWEQATTPKEEEKKKASWW